MDSLLPILAVLALLIYLELLALRFGADSREPMPDDRAPRASRAAYGGDR
jgi:hypothetical protein